MGDLSTVLYCAGPRVRNRVVLGLDAIVVSSAHLLRGLHPQDDGSRDSGPTSEASRGVHNEAGRNAPTKRPSEGPPAQSLGLLRADVVLLEADAFESHAALLEARRHLACPAVVLCPRAEAATLLKQLRAQDDVGADDEPAELVIERVRHARRRARPRDPLTGLKTRRDVMLELEVALHIASEVTPVSLVMIDIDHFKRVNDSHGHVVGDHVLRELAQRIGDTTPTGALLCRLGGEEFGEVLTTGRAAALKRAQEICVNVAASPVVDAIELTVSAGAATATEPMSPGDLIRQANEALYTAKARGRNRALHSNDLAEDARSRGLDPSLGSFEDFTRVVADRVAEVISHRGRKLFHTLREEADVDSLTHLFSRRYLDRRLPFEIDERGEAEGPLTVAMLDLDFFGKINKVHGWPTGDLVLSEIADVIVSQVRQSDWVARYGGEEMCVVLRNSSLEQSVEVLERVRTAVGAHRVRSSHGREVGVTVSVGAVLVRPGEDVNSVLERVSDKLLEAKRGGRDRLCS